MKPCRLRPQARNDRREQVQYYRREAGPDVANCLVDALHKAQAELALQPGIGSPVLGQLLGLPGLRVWRISGFPLSYWYFEREHCVDVVRLVGQRQDPILLSVDEG